MSPYNFKTAPTLLSNLILPKLANISQKSDIASFGKIFCISYKTKFLLSFTF